MSQLNKKQNNLLINYEQVVDEAKTDEGFAALFKLLINAQEIRSVAEENKH